jgi:hypothetical protein
MKTATASAKKKRSVKKVILWIVAVFLLLLSVSAVFLYFNFNRLLSSSLNKSFNSSIISDVYELKFEKLSVNLLTGNISVRNVTLQPREIPLHNYPYINSSFHLKAAKILLGNVQISTLIKSNILKLEKIELTAPGIDFTISDINPVFFPFKDSVAGSQKQRNKKPIESFFLKEFNLVDASFHVANSAKKREFNIQQINILLQDLMINQHPGKDIISYKHVEFSIGKLTGDMQEASLKHISFKDYKLTIDSLEIQHTYDTTTYRFASFSTGINALDIQTADSMFHVSMEALNLSYRDKSIKLREVSFKPNISESAIQARYPYRHPQFSGTIGSLEMTGVNFDSLIYSRKVLIEQILLDKVSASIFQDNSKPLDKSKFPPYLGQTITAIPIPLSIKQVKAKNVNLVNREKLPNGSIGKADIQRAMMEVSHITNISPPEMLTMKADAYMENKAHFNLILNFSYTDPKFTFNAIIDKCNLAELNPIVKSYTTATFNKGVLDGMALSGNASRTNASGTMKFLYHDLDITLALKEKAKWKSAVLAFSANTILPVANPSVDKPARIVQYHVDRDVNKSFVNLVIKSLLSGLKETFIMSKENKKVYKEKKEKAKEESKKNKK